jgi:hypothetical protein
MCMLGGTASPGMNVLCEWNLQKDEILLPSVAAGILS